MTGIIIAVSFLLGVAAGFLGTILLVKGKVETASLLVDLANERLDEALATYDRVDERFRHAEGINGCGVDQHEEVTP